MKDKENQTSGKIRQLSVEAESKVLCLVWFYGKSTIVGYLIHFYKYKQFYFKQFNVVLVQFLFTHS